MANRIGILGGSFDPIHLGHLLLAQDALEQMQLDAVYFIPAAQAPFKQDAPLATNRQRLEMIQLAISGYAAFEVVDYELRTGGTNYTVNTARWLKAQFPDTEFYWIVGADQVAQLSQWKDIATIFDYLSFICFRRPGYALEWPSNLPQERFHNVAGHTMDISSSEIRQRIAQGRPVGFFLCDKVADYIKENSLYEKLNDGSR
jgi:nicotinate-nucleotide adenylyltransferase